MCLGHYSPPPRQEGSCLTLICRAGKNLLDSFLLSALFPHSVMAHQLLPGCVCVCLLSDGLCHEECHIQESGALSSPPVSRWPSGPPGPGPQPSRPSPRELSWPGWPRAVPGSDKVWTKQCCLRCQAVEEVGPEPSVSLAAPSPSQSLPSSELPPPPHTYPDNKCGGEVVWGGAR